MVRDTYNRGHSTLDINLAHTKIQDVSKFVAAEINSFLPP